MSPTATIARISRKRALTIMARGRRVVDGWRPKVTKALQRQLKRQYREAAAALRSDGSLLPLSDLWARRRSALYERLGLPMMVAAYKSIGRMMFGDRGKAAYDELTEAELAMLEGFEHEALLANKMRPRLGKWINQSVTVETQAEIKRMSRNVLRWRREGRTGVEMGRRMFRLGVTETRPRADLLARTFTIWNYGEATVMRYRDAGIEQLEWGVTQDDLTCEFCGSMEGAIVGVGDSFADAGVTMAGEDWSERTYTPRYDTEHPPLHPRCRCVLLPVVVPVETATPAAEETAVPEPAPVDTLQRGIDATGEPLEGALRTVDANCRELHRRMQAAGQNIKEAWRTPAGRRLDQAINAAKLEANTALEDAARLLKEYADTEQYTLRTERLKIYRAAERKHKSLLRKVDKLSNDMAALDTQKWRPVWKELDVDRPSDIVMRYDKGVGPKSARRKAVDRAIDFVNKLTTDGTYNAYDPAISNGKPAVVFGRNVKRASAMKFGILSSSKSGTSTFAHELGHVLDLRNMELQARCRQFLNYRTQGESARSLRGLTGAHYSFGEVAKPDKFLDAYTGKIYHNATEILSMGLQHLYEDPLAFAAKDFEHFKFTVSLLRRWL